MSNNDKKIAELTKFFGNQLDRDVLASVLEISGGNTSKAIQFLQASNEQLKAPTYYNPLQKGDGLPKDYMKKPYLWKKPKKVAKKLSKNEKVANEVRMLIYKEQGTLEEHLTIASNEKKFDVYVAVILILLKQECELPFHAKWKILACCWNQHKFKLARYLLFNTKQFNLPEVLKAVKILDGQRKIRQLKKRIETLKKKGARRKTMNKVQTIINEIEKDAVSAEKFKTNVSGSLAKKVRNWVKEKFDDQELAYFSIHLPKDPWKQLADIVHFSPKDFKLKCFLPVAFGSDAPKESLVAVCKDLNVNNVEKVVSKYKIPYSYLRKQIPVLSTKVKELVCKYEKIDTLIWYYEELSSRGAKDVVDAIIEKRLEGGEAPSYNYGKLLERILYFKMNKSKFYEKLIPLAQKKLDSTSLLLEKPFVIFGDASYSMDVSIRTATIISSFVKAITTSQLFFFNDKLFLPRYQPQTIEGVLDIALNTKADGLTAPACVLRNYYKEKKVVKIFLMVTDEIENEKSSGKYFAELFYKYYNEVYPAKLVMISFLENPNANEKGRMVKALENLGIEVVNFVMHQIRPDLNKLNNIISKLTLETQAFYTSVDEMVKILKKGGVELAVKEIEKGLEKKKIVENKEELFSDEKFNFSKQKKGKKKVEKKVVEKKDDSAVKKKKIVNDGIPHEFKCPVTLEIMTDPVMASDGFSYEKVAILKWIESRGTSPMTGKKLETKLTFPNHQLKSKIREFMEKRLKDAEEKKKREAEELEKKKDELKNSMKKEIDVVEVKEEKKEEKKKEVVEKIDLLEEKKEEEEDKKKKE